MHVTHQYRTYGGKECVKIQDVTPYGRDVCSGLTREDRLQPRVVFLNRRAAARYRALASLIPGRDRFSWNLSFEFSTQFS